MHCGRSPLSCELDNKVLEHVEEVRTSGKKALSDQEVQQVARDLSQELGVTGFKASLSWLKRWKLRCERIKESAAIAEMSVDLDLGMNVTPNSTHECDRKTLDSNGAGVFPCQLTNLSMSDKLGGVSTAGCVTEVSGRPACADTADVSVCTSDDTTPEHNYSLTTLSSEASTSQLGCQTSSLQANMANLLENVALLNAHEQGDLGLTLGEGLNGITQPLLKGMTHCLERERPDFDSSANELCQETSYQPSILDYAELDSSQDFACSVPTSTSVLEEEQLMSVFNQRSFTDPFPFLPTSFVCRSLETSHSYFTDDIGIDDLMEAQLFDKGSKNGKNKGKAVQNGVPTLCTRASDPPTAPYLDISSDRQAQGSPSTSTNPEHQHSPSHGSLLGSSSYPSGLLSSLASRRSQPVFPDEPEIVFHEIQLGSLHMSPTV